jgi:hypothetical protein
MTELEDLLRTALATAPTPATSTPDPLLDLNRRLGRARLRLTSAALVGVVVVVAAVVVPLSLLGHRHRGPQAKTMNVPVNAWSAQHVDALTAGGGFVWTIGIKSTPNDVISLIQRRDPVTGRVLASYRIPDPEQFISYGLGKVWAWGGGDGGYPDGRLSVLTPATGRVRSASLGFGKGLDTSAFGYASNTSLGFAGHRAFGIRENSGGVVAIDPHDLAAADSQQPALRIAKVQSILGGRGTVYVRGLQGVIGQYPATRTWPPNGPSEPITVRGFPLLVTADGFWAALNHELVHEDINGTQIGAALPLPRVATERFLPAVTSVVVDRSGGLYAAIASVRNTVDLLYYSPAELRSAHPRPTAIHRGPAVDRIEADPAGGVVYVGIGSGSDPSVAAGFGIGRWDPTDPAVPSPRPAPVVAVASWHGFNGSTTVASGAGDVWTIGQAYSHGHQHTYVFRRDAATGRKLRSYRVPASESEIGFGLGDVWSWGGGSEVEGTGDGRLTVLTPSTGARTSVSLGANGGFGQLVFAGNLGFATQSDGRVIAFHRGDPSAATAAVVRVPGARRLAGLGGTLYVGSADHLLRQYAAAYGWPPTGSGEPVALHGVPLAEAEPDGFWLQIGGELVHEAADGRQVDASLVLPPGSAKPAARPGEVSGAIEAGGGLYVGLINSSGHADDLLYYSPAALAALHPQPTAVHHGLQNFSIALDPAGGVIATGQNEFGRWDPAGVV